jgi:hypothetical protein
MDLQGVNVALEQTLKKEWNNVNEKGNANQNESHKDNHQQDNECCSQAIASATTSPATPAGACARRTRMNAKAMVARTIAIAIRSVPMPGRGIGQGTLVVKGSPTIQAGPNDSHKGQKPHNAIGKIHGMGMGLQGTGQKRHQYPVGIEHQRESSQQSNDPNQDDGADDRVACHEQGKTTGLVGRWCVDKYVTKVAHFASLCTFVIGSPPFLQATAVYPLDGTCTCTWRNQGILVGGAFVACAAGGYIIQIH